MRSNIPRLIPRGKTNKQINKQTNKNGVVRYQVLYNDVFLSLIRGDTGDLGDTGDMEEQNSNLPGRLGRPYLLGD